jgi:UDP-N-acetylglucosamine 1-carboxyvinyltransferase
MATLRIEGGRRLAGAVTVEGNKNSALPLLAACLLTQEECVLSNVPRIKDVEVLIEIMRGLGATVEGVGTSTLRIRCESIVSDRPDPVLVGKLRGSVLLLGPLLARLGSARLAPPGGDFPARRTISTHLQALVALGAVPVDEPGHALDAPNGLEGASFYLDEASVTGTETALLAAAAARGRTEIRHAAMEPHVVELCTFLQAMGVSIEGKGTPTIRVDAPRRCGGATHRLHGDYIEAGSWGVVAAITGGQIEVAGARAEDMEVIAAPLLQMGLACTYESDLFTVQPSRLTATRRITTGLWPGFPSDMVSLVTVLATQADGRTLVHDWLYELRLFALEQLSAMRADLFLCDPHRIIVSGPKQLRGRLLDARDLRSGMALIAAALAAEGESMVTPLETVERGYASLVERLRALGATVERED